MSDLTRSWHVYSGVIHVHTDESDGTKTLEEVAAIGQEVGLDFIMFTDHMTLSNRTNGKEGFYGKTLALVGYEHNDPQDNNHYLLFDVPRVYPADWTVAQYVEAGSRDNALGIIAHPFEERDRMGKYPPFPWTDWNVSGFQAVELWNQMSEWMERLTPWNRLMLAFSPRKSMVGPPLQLLRKWDQLNSIGRCAGIASVDAHAFPIKVGPMTVEIFPYKVHFRSLRTYVMLPEPLSTDFDTARHQLYNAIRECRVWGANLRWGDASEFQFSIRNDKSEAVAGESLALTAGTYLTVSIPRTAETRVVQNGSYVHTSRGKCLAYNVSQPGIYRVEIWRGNRGWIFSNHIRVVV